MNNLTVNEITESLDKDYVKGLEALAQQIGTEVCELEVEDYISTSSKNPSIDYLDSMQIESYIEDTETKYLLCEDNYETLKKYLDYNNDDDNNDDVNQTIYEIYKKLNLTNLIKEAFYERVESFKKEFTE